MDVRKKYVVYQLNEVMGSKEHKALEKIDFKGWKLNSFDTEDEAVQAMIDDGKTYQDFIIVREFYITTN